MRRQRLERKRQPRQLQTGHRQKFEHCLPALAPLNGRLFHPHTLTVLDSDGDRNAVAHALGDGAESFELGEDAIKVLDLAAALAPA